MAGDKSLVLGNTKREAEEESEENMSSLNIPVGISDFAEIRRNGYYYVDKSALIGELLKTEATKVTLITRPRRFGKTLAMSMLAHFFDLREENGDLFAGLQVSEDPEILKNWMNQWPVVFLTLKNIDGLTFSSAYGQLKYEIADLYKGYDFLTEGEGLMEEERELFDQIRQRRAGDTEVRRSLQFLLQLLQEHFGKQVILLLDEYDVPLAKASAGGYYEEMLEVIRSMMITALKDNPCLRFAVITGCLKIAKESIFTGTNNFVSDTISSTRLNEYFGFTQKEVDKLLWDGGMTDRKAEIQKWYDGYHFGEVDVYCPWDVMNYVRDLQINPAAVPAGYWKNTSDNGIIRSFIDYAGGSISMKLETLMSGGYIVQKIEENLTYDILHSTEENLWSILYLTGYLTRVRNDGQLSPVREGETALMIPNEEIREIYETTVMKWFDDSARSWNRKALFAAVWEGNEERITEEMNRLLRKTISYHDYREDFYHAFLAGIFAGAGFMVQSNREHGEGRSDVAVYDPAESRAVIFEVKYSKTLASMEGDCERAAEQIERQGYARELKDDYDRVMCYGISFYKKRCLVKKND